jgi:putative restriction endonuclease
MPAPLPVADQLAATADSFTVPQGYRVEIIEGNIIVSPARRGWEALNVNTLQRELRPALRDGLTDAEMVGLELPETRQRYVPDVVVVPRYLLDAGDRLLPASSAVLVAEVTAPGRAEINRVRKLHGYLIAAVPNYLLVDRADSTVSLFTDPDGAVYRRHLQVPFGEIIDLPAPFDGALDTGRFA